MKIGISNKISSFEAKTHFSQLLQRVKKGERITIFNHNSPVAVIMPFTNNEVPDIQETIKSVVYFSSGKKLAGISIKDLINEGRK
jgi:prevent-host-death family protein